LSEFLSWQIPSVALLRIQPQDDARSFLRIQTQDHARSFQVEPVPYQPDNFRPIERSATTLPNASVTTTHAAVFGKNISAISARRSASRAASSGPGELHAFRVLYKFAITEIKKVFGHNTHRAALALFKLVAQ
jgi:hypothetical protein